MPQNLGEDLTHVRWIGGSACAGKTSVAARLAADYDLAVYSCDRRFAEHRRRADPGRHPRFLRLADRAPEELWTPPPAQQAEELMGFYEEEFEMVIDDLRLLAAGPVVAEGAGLLPTLLGAAGIDLRRCLWLVASPGFRRRQTRRRAGVSELLGRCADPGEARRRWLERDDLFADAVAHRARRLGGRVLTVDGRRRLEETAAEVARHLGLRGGEPS